MFQSDIDVVLLLTACVDPAGMEKTKLQNPDIRRQNYCDALDFYLERTSYRIVVVENTNYDFSAPYQKQIIAGRLEYLKFEGNQYPREFGKGYGEAETLEYAFAYSSMLNEAPYIMKITGRYIIPHVKALIRSTFFLSPRKKRIIGTNMAGDLSSAWSVCVIGHNQFWKEYLLPRKKWINDSKKQYFEHALREAIFKWITNNEHFQQYPLPILYQGISGTFGIAHKHSRKEYLVSAAKLFWIMWRIREAACKEQTKQLSQNG